MSLVARLEEIFEGAKAKAYEFETPIADSLKAIAQHVEQIAPGAGDVAGKLEELVASRIGAAQQGLQDLIASHADTAQEALDGALKAATTQLEAHGDAQFAHFGGEMKKAIDGLAATVDSRVTELFGQLLAKATAEEQAKTAGAPAAPAPASAGVASDPNAPGQAAPAPAAPQA